LITFLTAHGEKEKTQFILNFLKATWELAKQHNIKLLLEIGKGLLEQSIQLDRKISSLKVNFKTDVKQVAFGYLVRNEKYAQTELSNFGLTDARNNLFFTNLISNSPVSNEQTAKLQEIKKLASTARHLQNSMDEMLKVKVGFDLNAFDPNSPPIHDIKIGEQSAWEMTKDYWDLARIMLSKIANSSPVIFATLKDPNRLEEIAKADPTKDQKLLLGIIQKLMGSILTSIEKARTKIDSDDLDYRDLKPIHAQLFGGLKSNTGTEWNQPLNQWAAKEDIKDHKQAEYLEQLGLEIAAFAALLVADLATFGGATFLLAAGAGLGASWMKKQLAEEKYEGLAAASKSQVKDDTGLVNREQVTSAEAEAKSAKIDFFLSVAMLGAGRLAEAFKELRAAKELKESRAAGQLAESG
jgi:hypothetical protein